MTSPNGATPAGSATEGAGLAAWAAKSGDEWKAESTNDVKSSFEGPGGFWGKLLANLFSGFANLADGIGDVIGNIVGAITGGTGFSLGALSSYSSAQAQKVEVVQNKVEGLLTGGTRQTFGQSGTWTNPGPGKLIGIACVQGGWGGQSVSATGRSVGGRYVYAEFKSDDLPATVAVTVGGPGSGAVGGGSRSNPGTSSFGTFVKADGSGSGVLTAQGILVTDSNAGYGGLGSDSNGDRTVSDKSGTGNALSAGGIYTGSNPGTAGGRMTEGRIAVAGGGGGAGGPSLGALGVSTGGIGGWPGGAGGSGGSVGLGGSSNGGSGAYGAVFVMVKG